ncbi:MAG: hypothetical protein JO323_05000 [Acidobacteriia bacterium]|nr:hypothetical protein [Terriglobia bacterium]
MANERQAAFQDWITGEVKTVQASLEAMAKQVQELERQPAITVAPGIPRPGINLAKRSQVIRMSRRGEGSEQIAKALEVPLQEVELLLKVHQIVLNNI